jgi:hypothetical protein
MDLYPCNVDVFCFIPANIFFSMSPCNVENFVLPPYVYFFADVARKKWLPRQQSYLFADETMHFCWRGNHIFMPHQQKSQYRGVKQICSIARGHSQKK